MSGFPLFKDGDVKIVITGSRQYQLHSNILRASSRTMLRLLDEQYTAKLTSKAIKKGVVVRNRLEAVNNPDLEPHVEVLLEPIHLDSDGKTLERKPIGLDLENGMPVPYVHTVKPREDIVIDCHSNTFSIGLSRCTRSFLPCSYRLRRIWRD